MTDTATQLADFLSLAAANVALPAAIATTANARIAAHQSAWDARLAALDGTIYVNQVTGADTAEGTAAGPMQSVQAAIDRAPRGGAVTITLQGAYNFATQVDLKGRNVRLVADGSIRHSLTFERSVSTALTRVLAGIRFGIGSKLAIGGLKIVVPDITGYTMNADYGDAVVFGIKYPNYQTFVGLVNCDIQIGATPFGALVSDAACNALTVVSCTFTDQPAPGKIVRGQTNTGGVAASTIPSLLTNLTTI